MSWPARLLPASCSLSASGRLGFPGSSPELSPAASRPARRDGMLPGDRWRPLRASLPLCGCANGCLLRPPHRAQHEFHATTLRTQRGDKPVDKPVTRPASVRTHGVEKPVGEGGQAASRMWTDRHPLVHDAGRGRGHGPSVHSPSPGGRRVVDSSSTGPKRGDQGEQPLSPASTSVKTRNEHGTHRMDSPPTSGSGRPFGEAPTSTDREVGPGTIPTRSRGDPDVIPTCRPVHSAPPPRVLSCGRS